MNQTVNIGTLGQSQRQEFARWLQACAVRNVCPACGSGNLSILDKLVQPIPFTGGGLSVGGMAFPLAMVACGRCGNVQFYSAVLAGLVARAAP